MKEGYALSTMKRRKNSYASMLKNLVAMCLIKEVVDGFKALAEEEGISYQSLQEITAHH